MFRILTAVCVSLLLPSIVSAKADYRLSKHQAGHVTLGMTIAKVMSQFPKGSVRVIKKQMEGETYVFLDICHRRPCAKADLLAELSDAGTVNRMTVFSHLYKTKKDVGVGSTYRALKKAHTIARVDGGEMDVLYAVVPSLGMSFAFPLAGGQKGTIRAGAKVVSVLIW